MDSVKVYFAIISAEVACSKNSDIIWCNPISIHCLHQLKSFVNPVGNARLQTEFAIFFPQGQSMATIPQQMMELAIRLKLSKEATESLVRRAAESGQDVGTVASDLLEKAVKPALGAGSSSSTAQRVGAWDAWVAAMRDWRVTNLPPRHTVDDSRESIYKGRGE